MRGVSVVAAGHTILHDVDLDIRPGEHVAVVGQSGAGKSSLVGLLLGWHTPASGCVEVDGEPLEGGRLVRLRGETAWVDPSVHLWNRSLATNLSFGNGALKAAEIGEAVDAATLREVLDRLPAGLQQPLGEGGGLLSGGEGQRVRIARALLHPGPRLVVLDEAFRGLDSCHRATLLDALRERWRGRTLLCVTHDVAHARRFDRVVVMASGRVGEVGPPESLLREPGSLFRAMLEREQAAGHEVWRNGSWRVLHLGDASLEEARA